MLDEFSDLCNFLLNAKQWLLCRSEEFIHPLIEHVWEFVKSQQVKRKTSVYIDEATNEMWSAGVWIEQGFLRLPARTYRIEVITVSLCACCVL